MPFFFWNSCAAAPATSRRHEVRREPHHRPGAPFGEMDVAFDVDQPAQPRRRRVPEKAALEEAAAEPAEMLAAPGARAPRARAPESTARGCAARPCGAKRRRASRAGRADCRAPPGRRAAASATATEPPTATARPSLLLRGPSGATTAACGPHANASIRRALLALAKPRSDRRPRARSSKRPAGGPGTTLPIMAASPSY